MSMKGMAKSALHALACGVLTNVELSLNGRYGMNRWPREAEGGSVNSLGQGFPASGSLRCGIISLGRSTLEPTQRPPCRPRAAIPAIAARLPLLRIGT